MARFFKHYFSYIENVSFNKSRKGKTTDKLDHIKLYRVHLDTDDNRTTTSHLKSLNTKRPR
jgi:hypothetical protein